MIDYEKTQTDFEYNISSLSCGSNKKIVAICDYCKDYYIVTYKNYNNSRKIVEKDACKKCKYEKRKDISLKLYGVENSAQRPEVRKKISKNCEGFDDKRRNTMKKKYGVNNPMQNKKLKEKQQKSVLDKYGVENVSQIKEVRDKVEQTNLQKYGHKAFLASEEGKRKKTEGIKKKYGVENVFQSEEIKQKIKDTNLKKYGVSHHLKNQDRATIHAQLVLDSKIKNGQIKIYDGKTVKEWLKDSEYSNSRFRVLINKYGFDVARSMTPRFSYLEQIFEQWLIKEKINYQKQFMIENKYADFLLTDINIVIELDGLYWHSEAEQEKHNYHAIKRQLYIDNGYTPLFFREDEINNSFDIIKSIVLNKMKKSDSIFARKCKIVNIDRRCSQEFFNKNHLMGQGRGVTCGLEYNNEIISAIIIRKIRDKHYEISRFCHKLGYQVVGGFSRLFKHFLNQNDVDILTTFIDLRYGNGNYLCGLGFKHINTSLSFKWTDCINTFHRMRFRGNSGYSHNLVKIWDCGQSRYDFLNNGV